MESKRKISGKAVIIIIIFFAAILFVKRDLYIRNNSTEKHNTKDTENRINPSSRSEKKQVNSSFFSSPRSWEDYQVIVDNNLFRPLGWEKSAVKEVVKKTTPKTETIVKTPQERPAPTYNLTLTGIAQNGSEWTAIFEDITRKEGYFLHSGEKLKDSLVSEIFPEHIILAQGDIKAKLPLGANIQYNTNGQILLDSVKNSQYSTEKEQKVGEDEDKLQSLIERMKARRRKELEKE